MPLKHLPIQPNLAPANGSGVHTSNVSIAPNPQTNFTRDSRKTGASHGLVIRTSRQWVLPPRPKPGRKPSLSALPGRNTSANGSGETGKNGKTNTGAVANPSDKSATAKSGSCAKIQHHVANNEDRASAPPSIVKIEPQDTPLAQVLQESPVVSQSISEAKRKNGKSTKIVSSSLPGHSNCHPDSSRAHAETVVSVKGAGADATAGAEGYTASRDKLSKPAAAVSEIINAPSAAGTVTNAGVNPTVSTTPMLKKLTKTALKKEVQRLKLENFKLKQEMGHLVGNLQDLKQKFTFLNDVSSAISPTSLGTVAGKKRPYLDSSESHNAADSTDSFLKFEDDNEEEEMPGSARGGVMMRPTMSFSSQYSSKTNLTDDEDPGFSSSTPSSLFSAELQRSVTNSSFVGSQQCHHNMQCNSHNSSGTPGYSPHYHGSTSPSSIISAKLPGFSSDGLKFIDDYEHQDFYHKHRHMFEIRNSSGHHGSSTVSPTMSNQPGDLHLDSIKEEDMNFKLDQEFGNDDMSILNFLENHPSKVEHATTSTAVTNTIPRWVIKEGEQALDLNVFQEAGPEPTILKQEFHIPPSLEELMGEQEPDRIEMEIKREDDDDMSRMNVFDFA
ncbi:LADA_0G10352g1_1 [Lachancea dasiensis]|uniref:LADA_0G10352g1_1 n=1 Tax=Lachancea dasiensis TaxID=1072105 RepID=A0A1G4JUN2_9SACH|nr:LADA_0G10352g1_1 [Lachancea dasiensis]